MIIGGSFTFTASSRSRFGFSMQNKRSLYFENLESRKLLAAIVTTNQEQLLLELVNRARANPAAEAARFAIDLNDKLPAGTLNGAPKQPLAPNQLLINAAGLHSQDMLNNDFFDHVNLAGKNPGARIADSGYVAASWSENIAWGGSTGAIDQIAHVFERHEGLFKSPGHRVNLLNTNYFEVGMGVRYGTYTSNGQDFNASMVTEKFASRTNKIFITGVAYSDAVAKDAFYTIGEGLGGLTVVAVKSTGERVETVTGTSGGYALEVSPGTYAVTFSGGVMTAPVTFGNVVVGGFNVKVDLNSSQLAALSLTLDKISVNENAGSLTATIRRSGGTTEALQVNIVSNQRTQASFPTSITIPAGVDSVSFTVNSVDDNLPDGDQDVTIEVTAINHTASVATLKVVDNDRLVAQPDQRLTLINQAVDVAVLSNDIFPNSQLADLIVEITTPPDSAHGTAQVANQGIRVSPATDFRGVISVAYRIRDPRIGESEAVFLRIGVAATHKQNALAPLDVDANGTVAPSDALIVINLLNDINATRLVDEMPSPLVKPFVDVNGSGNITPVDALLIINALNSRSDGGEGESNASAIAMMVDWIGTDRERDGETLWKRRHGRNRSWWS